MDQKTFKAKSDIKWYRCKIDSGKLNSLMQRSNLQGLRQAGGLLFLCACTGFISYFIFSLLNGTNWYWCLPCLLISLFLHGSVCHFLGGVSCHELLHRTPFKNKNKGIKVMAPARNNQKEIIGLYKEKILFPSNEIK